MNWKKLLALVLSLAMVLSLAACGNGDADGSPASPDTSPSNGEGLDNPGNSPAGSDPADYVAAYTQALAGIDPDTVMFTVNGEPVTAEYYFYWLSYDCYYWDSMYQTYTGQGLDFDAVMEDGLTNADFLKDDAKQMAGAYFALEQQAAANNVGVTAEQEADWAQRKADYVEQNGADSFDFYLRQQGLSEEAFDRIGVMNNFLYDNVLEALTQDPTQAEADQYAQDNSIFKAKHILIQTVTEKEDGTLSFYRGGTPTNEDGSEYTGTADEYNAASLEKATELLARLDASEDPIALFDELMNEYCEDPGAATQPEGYVFGEGQMAEEFESAVKELKCGAYSAELVQTVFGYHIILRLSPSVADVADSYRSAKMNELMSGWVESMEVVTTEAYDALDAKSFYTNYVAYAESLNEQQNGGDDAALPEEGGSGEG